MTHALTPGFKTLCNLHTAAVICGTCVGRHRVPQQRVVVVTGTAEDCLMCIVCMVHLSMQTACEARRWVRHVYDM